MTSKIKKYNNILHLILNTWSNDSIGLYDYSSSSITKLTAFISKSTYLVRKKGNIFQNIDQHADIDTKKGDDLLFQVNGSNNGIFNLINPIPKNLKLTQLNFDYLNNKIWYVIKSENKDIPEKKDNNNEYNEEYYLNENDVIKLGGVKFAVQKIFIRPEVTNNLSDPPGPVIEAKYNISDLNKNTPPIFDYIYEANSDYANINEEKEKIKCRYCENQPFNKETDDEDNFLISFCNCQELVHYKCLKNKMKLQMEIKNEAKQEQNIETMTIKDFECPNCSNEYPVYFKLSNADKIFNLVDIKEPKDCDYMILESIDYKQYKQFYKSIHIIKFKKETIRIGRENNNDVISNDISISPHHALLELNNNKIYIRNLSQKFGTLVLIKNPLTILNKTIYLQVGRTYIKACLVSNEENGKKETPQKK